MASFLERQGVRWGVRPVGGQTCRPDVFNTWSLSADFGGLLLLSQGLQENSTKVHALQALTETPANAHKDYLLM